MAFRLSNCENAETEIASAHHPMLRQFAVERRASHQPERDTKGTWAVCTPYTAQYFPGVGYFFGRYLMNELRVPIGLINASWGGTPIEAWTPVESASQEHDPARSDADLSPPDRKTAGGLYNTMIAPLTSFAVRGAIWYHGEANHRDGMTYKDKMKALVGSWRSAWGEGDFPFYFVQLTPFHHGDEDPGLLPAFWEAQSAAEREIPDTGMVVTLDIGDYEDGHPRNKADVGKRLALLALRETYGRKEIVARGPTFRSLTLAGRRLRVDMDNVGNGLVSRDGKPLTGFEIIDATEARWVPAQAVIKGDSIVLSSPEVARPVAMRFAWAKNASPNLMNREGLPAGAFRAGEVPRRTPQYLRLPDLRNYELVYHYDLSKADAEMKAEIDHSATIGPFSRIAYVLEIEIQGNPRWIYVSMDAFTDDITQIGVPTVASKASFQQKVSQVDVLSNVQGVVTGKGLDTCNIEFWPNNYAPQNTAEVPNASNEAWDFGDQRRDPLDGYGSMQVSNFGARQVLFSFNNWKSGPRADLGIGNNPEGNLDWTLSRNAGTFPVRHLTVLVKRESRR
jgi:sialate O-acetylesterase